MDIFVVFILFLFAVYITLKIRIRTKINDFSSIEQEIEKDFESEFEYLDDGQLSTRGMEELVKRAEDDLIEKKISESPVIDDVKRF